MTVLIEKNKIKSVFSKSWFCSCHWVLFCKELDQKAFLALTVAASCSIPRFFFLPAPHTAPLGTYCNLQLIPEWNKISAPLINDSFRSTRPKPFININRLNSFAVPSPMSYEMHQAMRGSRGTKKQQAHIQSNHTSVVKHLHTFLLRDDSALKETVLSCRSWGLTRSWLSWPDIGGGVLWGAASWSWAILHLGLHDFRMWINESFPPRGVLRLFCLLAARGTAVSCRVNAAGRHNAEKIPLFKLSFLPFRKKKFNSFRLR